MKEKKQEAVNRKVDTEDENEKDEKGSTKSKFREESIYENLQLTEKTVRWMKSSSIDTQTGDAKMIMALEDKQGKISYDRLQGRPSITVIIEEEEIECLLDTGAAMNVITAELAGHLKTATINSTNQRLTAANGAQMNVMGELKVICKLGQTKKI